MKRILIILINIIFINMIASTSNRENIASIISIFISLQLLFLLKLYITIEYPKLTIVRENLYFSLLLLLIIFLIQNERIKFFILELMIITISGSIVLSIYLFIKKLEMFYIFYLLNILFLINFWINRILDLDKSFPYKLVISETSLLLNSLYICMESQEIISPENSFAMSTLNFVFPTDVGPTINIIFFFIFIP